MSVCMSGDRGQLGVWLRQEMLRRGYDVNWGGQSQLAREANIHSSIINRALVNGAGMKIDVLRRLGNALGYSLGEMLVFSGDADRDELPVRPPEELEEAPAPEPDTNPFDEPHERQVWGWEDLSEDVRRHVIIALRTALQLEADAL